MAQAKILVFAGSARKNSWNKKLAAVAAAALKDAGADATLVDLADYPMPIMDEDLQAAEGLPANATAFKKLMFDHDGFLIVAPEYNSSITPLLKNVIDWASRKEGDEKPLQAYTGKTVALMSASPGALGGLRGLVHLRAIFGNIGVLVLPDQFALVKANEAFDESGALKDEKQAATVARIAAALVKTTAALKG